MNRAKSRRQYFIRPEFQGKYIVNNLLIALAGSAVFALLAAFFSAGSRVFIYRDYTLQVGNPASIFLRELASAQLLYIVTVGIVVIYLAIIMSHRVAGPMVKMERALDAMAGGDYTGLVSLRRKDEGQALAAKINAVSESLAERMGVIDQLLKELEAKLAADEDLREKKELEQLVCRLRTHLAHCIFSGTPS